MAITFGPLDTVEVSAQVDVGLLLSVAATASRTDMPRTETSGFADLDLLLSIDGRSVALLAGQADVDVGLVLSVDATAVIPTPEVHTTGAASLDLVLSIDGTMEAYSDDVAPAIPASVNVDFALYAEAEIEQVLHLNADVDVAFALSAEALPPNFCEVEFLLHMDASSAVVPQAYGFLVLQPPVMVGYAGLQFASLAERLVVGESLDTTLTAVIRALIELRSGTAGIFAGTVRAGDTVAFAGEVAYALRVLIEEGLVMGDTLNASSTAFGRVLARLLVSGAATGYADALVRILDALVMAATADAIARGDVAETAVLSGIASTLYEAFARILERLVLGADLTGTSTAFVIVRERVALSADLTHVDELVAVLRDGAGFAATLAIDNGEYIAWVMNTDGDKPVSRYTAFPFNSFAKVGGRYMACDSTGLHWLDGGTDSGEAINARLRAGLQAMGTRREKRMPEAFLYMRTDGQMRLQVIQVDADTGEKVAGWFKVLARPAANSRETRVKTGRGWKAVEFDYVLENIAGADFDVTSIEPRPLNLDRRTRG